jgi:Bacterial PH domain
MVGMARPDRATFRLPLAALFFPVLLLFCITPLATAGGLWWIAFIVPLLALVWVIVTRTTATRARVAAYGLLGARRMDWTEMDGLEFNQSRWAIAVALDGRRVRLPMVRPRDLPRLAAVSGGSLRLGPDAPIESAQHAVPTAEPPVDESAEPSVDGRSVVDQGAPDAVHPDSDPAEQTVEPRR